MLAIGNLEAEGPSQVTAEEVLWYLEQEGDVFKYLRMYDPNKSTVHPCMECGPFDVGETHNVFAC